MSSKPIARDFKRSRRQGLDYSRWKEFGAGLGIGLAVALTLFAYQRNALQKAINGADAPRPESRRAARSEDSPVAEAGVAGGEESTGQYDFYDMLPRFEVVVPEKEQEVKRDLPNAAVERPGVYVLQAGSYRRAEDAQRVRQQLSLQGIDATVQRVAVDSDVWHRVRVGPLNDLREVNRLRARLRSADLNALVIRVGD